MKVSVYLKKSSSSTSSICFRVREKNVDIKVVSPLVVHDKYWDSDTLSYKRTTAVPAVEQKLLPEQIASIIEKVEKTFSDKANSAWLKQTIEDVLYPARAFERDHSNLLARVHEYLEKLKGRVQRLSVGVQSFDDDLLRQMDRYEKYGSGQEILERIQEASPYFTSMNADMIFNFPAQTEDTLIHDIEMVVASGASQTTFYPLMASPSVQRSLAATVGKVDYNRERRFYEIICDLLLGDLPGGQPGLFELGSAWTFNRRGTGAAGEGAMIDEYVVDYEEYPAIGSGGITYLGENLYVNTFSVREYNTAIEAGHMSMMGKTTFSLRDRMRYRFMMQLFGLRLDKRQFERDFGMSVERGLPVEMGFMRACGAFATDNADELTLTPKGRYLVVVMMRQFFIGVNNLRDQARAALTGEERELIFGDGKGC